MSIFEYDEELEMKKLRKEEYNFGVEDGRAEGISIGKTEGIRIGRAAGEQTKLISQICRKLRKKKTPEQIADELEEKLSSILPILKTAASYAPEYDEQSVCRAVFASEEQTNHG